MYLRRYINLMQVPIRLFSTKTIEDVVKTSKTTAHKKLKNFFEKDTHLKQTMAYVPTKYLQITRKQTIDNLYLICPKAAKIVADIISPALGITDNQIVAESSPGLGLVSQELLDKGIKRVRFYESCSEFRQELKEFANIYPNQIELYTKNLFHLYRYAYFDKQDNGRRVESLLNNVPVRSWKEDPVMSIIGTVTTLRFFKYLLLTLCLQTGLTTHGRINIFAFMKPSDYIIFTATNNDSLRLYQKWTVLFNLFCEHKLLEKFPREIFVPWQSQKKVKQRFNPRDIDPDQIYLVEIKFKKELPVPMDQLMHLYFFLVNLYGTGSRRVIPTIEKCVPDAGYNILVPRLKHDDYYEEFDIFTKFRNLTCQQILSLYKEVVNSPSYQDSPFHAMIESTLLRSETIETSTADTNLVKSIMGEIQEKMEDEI